MKHDPGLLDLISKADSPTKALGYALVYHTDYTDSPGGQAKRCSCGHKYEIGDRISQHKVEVIADLFEIRLNSEAIEAEQIELRAHKRKGYSDVDEAMKCINAAHSNHNQGDPEFAKLLMQQALVHATLAR